MMEYNEGPKRQWPVFLSSTHLSKNNLLYSEVTWHAKAIFMNVQKISINIDTYRAFDREYNYPIICTDNISN